MIRTFQLTYDTWGATVIIDTEKAAPYLKEMVHFWMSAEQRLKEADGDYALAFVNILKQTLLEVSHELGPVVENMKKVEGYCPLDGSHGITVEDCDSWSFDVDVHVTEKKDTRAASN